MNSYGQQPMAPPQGRQMIPPNPNNLVNNGMSSSQSVRIISHTKVGFSTYLLLTMRANYHNVIRVFFS